MKIETRKGKWLISAMLLWLAFAPLAQAFYNPSTGRWLSRDPIGEKGGNNLYRIGHNSLPNETDSVGKSSAWHFKWCLLYPSCCCKVHDSDKLLYRETWQRYGTLKGGTVVNAIMHCAWMCYVSSRCSKAAANGLGVAHELDHPDNPKRDQEMDFHNNDVGVRIGGTNLADCFDRCERAARNNELYWIDPLDSPVPGLPTDVPGPPDQKEIAITIE